MTELKTLKDMKQTSLTINFYDEKGVLISDLKQEAIRWIKDFRTKIENHSHGDKSDPLYLNCISCRNMFIQIRWIGHFFSITDEDLK